MSESVQMKRLLQEMKDMKVRPSDMLYAYPLENDMKTWHFTIRGPAESDFEKGIYHGIIELAKDYPINPPNLYFLTPNGRFELKTKICLNITKFHKDQWNPSWTIRAMLEALICFFGVKENATGVGALDYGSEERKNLALKSVKYVCDKCGAIDNLIPLVPRHLLPKQHNEEKTNEPLPEPTVEQAYRSNEETKKIIEEEEVKFNNQEIPEIINEGVYQRNKNIRENHLNNLMKNILNRKMMDLESESQGEKSGRDRQNSSENLDDKYEDFIPYTFENQFTTMQETIESIKFNKNFLKEEEERQRNIQAQVRPNTSDSQASNQRAVPNLNQQTSLEELNIKSQKSSEILEENNINRNSEENLQENVLNEEEKELSNTMIQSAKQNLALTDFFLFFLGSFFIIYILLYIYVF